MVVNKIYVKSFDTLSLISALNRHKNTKENYSKDDNSDDDKLIGISMITFTLILLINIAIWLWALQLLLKYKKEIPTWALIVGICGLVGLFIPAGPLVTIIVVYATKN